MKLAKSLYQVVVEGFALHFSADYLAGRPPFMMQITA